MFAYLRIRTPWSLCRTLPVSQAFILTLQFQGKCLWQGLLWLPVSSCVSQRLSAAATGDFPSSHHRRESACTVPGSLMQLFRKRAQTTREQTWGPFCISVSLLPDFFYFIFFSSSLLQMWTENKGPPVLRLCRWHHAAAAGEPGSRQTGKKNKKIL